MKFQSALWKSFSSNSFIVKVTSCLLEWGTGLRSLLPLLDFSFASLISTPPQQNYNAVTTNCNMAGADEPVDARTKGTAGSTLAGQGAQFPIHLAVHADLMQGLLRQRWPHTRSTRRPS